MSKFSHGGEREGAGQKPKWHNGATVTVRLPQVLKDDVLRYACLIDGQFPNGLQVGDSLSCNLETVTESRGLPGQLEAVTTERDRLDSECNELAARVGDLNLELETTQQALQTEIDALRSEVSQLQEQLELNQSPQLQLEATQVDPQAPQDNLNLPESQSEVTRLLRQAITPESKGGVYVRNNAKSVKEVIQQVLDILAQTTPTT